MSAQHAPGPWSVGQHYRIHDAAGGPIAHVNSQYAQSAKDAQATARLIAAAPELLDALQYLMYCDNGEPEYAAARAAIEKATKP